MRRFTRDLRQGWRSLARRKAFTLTCAGTLTLVLGANAGTFAVLNAAMLRPLPFATTGPVVHLFTQPPGTTAALARNPLQQMEVPRLRERARTLARLEGFYLSERVVTLSGEPAVARTAAVTPGLLSMMGAPVVQGRWFTPEEGTTGHFVAIVTERYGRDTFRSGGLGETLVIDGQPHSVVGVLSPAFAVPFLDADVFTPLVASAEPQPRSPPRTVVGLAEIAPGVTLAQVRQELTTIDGELAREFPRTHRGWSLGAEWVREWRYGSLRAPLLILLAAGAFVLLIACVNIANLTTAQAAAKSGELALRRALGASTRDLVRSQLAESLIVCAAGLVPGLLLAWVAVPALLAINPTVGRSLGGIEIDWRVQTFSALVAVLVALVASVAPAMRAARDPVAGAVAAAATRTTGSAGAAKLQRALVACEVALCLALLMAGAVLVRGLRDLTAQGPGYDAGGVLTAQIRLPEASYPSPERRVSVVNQMLEEIRVLPGVASAGITQNAFVPGFSYQTLVGVKDRPTEDGQLRTVQFRRVSPDYFKTMRIRILSGRLFREDDTADRPAIAIVSRRLADMFLPGLDPIGRVLIRNNPPYPTIVGVVDDVSDVSVIERPEPTLYLPWSQSNNFGVPVAFVVRTTADPRALVQPMRESLRRIDASLPLRSVQPLDTFVQESTAPERFRTMVLGVIAMLGLVLAALGISGMTYRSVVARRREFAVRLALGSTPSAVVGLVMAEWARDFATGALAGLAGGAAVCVGLARALEHVRAVDAATTGVALGVVVIVGLAAALLPARQIIRLDPAEALRT